MEHSMHRGYRGIGWCCCNDGRCTRRSAPPPGSFARFTKNKDTRPVPWKDRPRMREAM